LFDFLFLDFLSFVDSLEVSSTAAGVLGFLWVFFSSPVEEEVVEHQSPWDRLSELIVP